MKKIIEYCAIGIIGLVIIFILLVVAIPIKIIMSPIDCFIERKYEKKFKQFLYSIEGCNFFIYNNRKKSLNFIEDEVLSRLKKEIRVLYLENRELKNESNRFYTTLIYRVKNYTKLPHLIKIRNGEIYDVSINQELFIWKNQSKNTKQFFDLINVFFDL